MSQAHPFFHNTSLALSVFPLLFGVNAMFRPTAHLQALGFPLHDEPTAKKLNLALMRIWSVRNLSVGFLLALIWNTGDERLMAKGLGAGVAMSLTDGFVSRLLTGGGETQHWIFPPVVAVVMAGLYGWFD
ncbi:uncharacterized protein PV06_09362 [Exophiala oligosperma]|uniref:Integral membrane protein n=2 Tax=Chaetothyriales TaxID=34395 RepID=A0A0D2ADZ4_9EURO|nr:uncharacterized protein PV06_09362 [Exophiala oligosperma]KAJ9635315.1 hypothetical protein H2204_005876 [Knufia peltigerae]KIW38391.1 hypothetical protein PV06_09362 [Exophiala oligosperma]